jgi:hypothetical protein
MSQASSRGKVLDAGVETIKISVDAYLVPALGVAHVPQRNVVVLAPEEGNNRKAPLPTEHVLGCQRPLPLCHYPVLDSDAFT